MRVSFPFTHTHSWFIISKLSKIPSHSYVHPAVECYETPQKVNSIWNSFYDAARARRRWFFGFPKSEIAFIKLLLSPFSHPSRIMLRAMLQHINGTSLNLHHLRLRTTRSGQLASTLINILLWCERALIPMRDAKKRENDDVSYYNTIPNDVRMFFDW